MIKSSSGEAGQAGRALGDAGRGSDPCHRQQSPAARGKLLLCQQQSTRRRAAPAAFPGRCHSWQDTGCREPPEHLARGSRGSQAAACRAPAKQGRWDTPGQQQQAARPPHLSTHPSGTAQQRCPGGGGRPPECPQAVPVRLTREQTLLRARRAAVLRQCRGSCSHLTPPRPPHLGTGAGLQHVEVSASAQLLAGGVEVAAQGAAGARREAETSQLLLQLWTQLQLFHSIPQHSTPWGCSTSTRGGRSPLKRWAEGAGQGSSFRTQHC